MAGGMLEGVKVVDLTSVVIGPLCTQILADHGAEVIKVESFEGDVGRHLGGRGRTPGMAPKFLHLNRNKRSICLDLKHPLGHQALLRLLADADVMTWNVRPDSMARMKLSYDEVRAVRPDIIYCGMFGFGQKGRYAKVAAYDPVVQGAGGVAGLIEKAFGEPRFVPYVLADRTGGLIAVQMIAMALFHRERTGRGQSIEVPMFENMATQVLTEHLYNRTYVPPLGEAGDPRLVSPYYTPMKTADGYISITANTNAQVFPLFDAMGLAHLKTDPRFDSVAARFANVKEYFALRAEGMKKHTTAFWMALCREHDIPAGPYHTLESLIDDPHLADVGFIREREHPTEGTILDLMPANTLSEGARADWSPAPHLGEQTRAVLAEAGFADAEIDRMIAAGAARAHTPKAD
ncbi:MAG: CoA transferase [Burkholderiales bacterium]|nr:CoA transferase [Burkholderiales bacterium]